MWQKGMKSMTKGLGLVGVSRLPGWGPRDPPNVWLQTLQEMAANRSQWRMCCQVLSSSSDWMPGGISISVYMIIDVF